MPGCCVKGCFASATKGLNMFRVPVKSPRRSSWRNAIKRSPEKSSASWYVCELHFSDGELLETEGQGGGKLPKAAIPSVFCDCPGYSVSTNADPNATRSLSTQLNLHVSSATSSPRNTSASRRRIHFAFQDENSAPHSNQLALARKRKIVGEHSEECSLMKRRKLSVLTNISYLEEATTLDESAVSPEDNNLLLLSADLGFECSIGTESTVSASDIETIPTDSSQSVSVGTNTEMSMDEINTQRELSEKIEKSNIILRQSNQNLRNQLASEKNKNDKLESENKKLKGELQNIISGGKFGQDQLKALSKPPGQRTKCHWLPETITDGLKLWFAAGGTAYSSVVRILGKPMPSIRTLERHIQDIQMIPGLQEPIFEALDVKLQSLVGGVMDCVFGFDEMAVQKGVQYNKGTKRFVGYCSLPGTEGLASKAMLYSIAGLQLRIKQTLGYDFTSAGAGIKQDEEIGNRVIDGVMRCGKINVKVLAVVSDMGNRRIWRYLGIHCTKNKIVYWIPHPFYPGERLYFLADVCHLFKNAVEMLKTHLQFTLSQDIVEEFDLPSATVELSHFKTLIEFQEDESGEPMELRLTPRLAAYDLKSNHFNKMKVSNARKLFNHRNAVGLQIASEEIDEPDLLTTAWFTYLLHYWFLYCTARKHELALSLQNKEAYDDAIAILKLTIRVFQSIKISDQWKPVQSGIIFSTSAILDLQEYLLVQRHYDFVLLGYFTQDFVENEISQYRRTWKNPTAIQFEQKTKLRCLSRFFESPGKSSSYDADNREDAAVDIRAFKGPRSGPSAEVQTSDVQLGEVPECPDFDLNNGEPDEVSEWLPSVPTSTNVREKELPVIYYLSGYILHRFSEERKSCETCIAAATHHDVHPHPQARFTGLASYKRGALVMASDILFQLLLSVEKMFRQHRSTAQRNFLNCAMDMAVPLITSSPLPSCHQIAENLTTMFLEMRLFQWGAHITNSLSPKEREEAAYSSRSIAGTVLTNNWPG